MGSTTLSVFLHTAGLFARPGSEWNFTSGGPPGSKAELDQRDSFLGRESKAELDQRESQVQDCSTLGSKAAGGSAWPEGVPV